GRSLRVLFNPYNRLDHHTHATIYLLNPFVGALSYYGITRTIQGFLDEGIARAIEATQQPEEVKHPDTLAFALMQLCYVLFLREEPQEASPCVARLAQVARQHGLLQATVVADMFGGWVATEAGRLEEGLHTAQRAFKILQDAELLVNRFSTLPIICEVLKKARLVEEAIGYINDLLTIPREDSYESFHPELWRLKGDFLVLLSENSDASL